MTTKVITKSAYIGTKHILMLGPLLLISHSLIRGGEVYILVEREGI